MTDKTIYLTQEEYDALKEQVANMQNNMTTLYENVKHELNSTIGKDRDDASNAILEGKQHIKNSISIYQSILDSATIIDASETLGVVNGDRVTFEQSVNGGPLAIKTYTVVGNGANPSLGIISNQSPYGKEFFGKTNGHLGHFKFQVNGEIKTVVYRILEITKADIKEQTQEVTKGK